tara:strand:- start:767 stop:1498 length:732 start_codon:yes stop_codon:yes gene_type:complete
MVITSLYTYIAILIRKKLPNGRWFFPAFLIGLIIPDLDTIIIYLNFSNINLNNHTFGHSIISALIIYLILLIIYEINKKKEYLNLANGIISGMLFHIFCDVIISINLINIFWPLPFKSISIYDNIIIQYYLKPYINIIIFLFFRYFFFYSIECIVNSSRKKGYLVKLLTRSMKAEIYIIILYTTFTVLNIKNISNLIFYTGYCFSMFIVYYTIIRGWNSFNNFRHDTNKQDSFKKERELININ